jgi:hypothetical protein
MVHASAVSWILNFWLLIEFQCMLLFQFDCLTDLYFHATFHVLNFHTLLLPRTVVICMEEADSGLILQSGRDSSGKFIVKKAQ